MIITFLYFLYIAALIVCCLLSLISIRKAISNRKNTRQLVRYTAFGITFIIATCFIWSLNPTKAETTNRNKASRAFEEDFGFKPPAVIKEIKLKNYAMHDAGAHWIAFTYDSIVLNKILDHDQPLEVAIQGSPEYKEISKSLEKGCANCPSWLVLLNGNTPGIFFKKNFLAYQHSEYYLWVDIKENMVFLEVSNSD